MAEKIILKEIPLHTRRMCGIEWNEENKYFFIAKNDIYINIPTDAVITQENKVIVADCHGLRFTFFPKGKIHITAFERILCD